MFGNNKNELRQVYLTCWNSYKKCKGFRLCAIDGSSIRLPDEPDITDHFGVQKGRIGKEDCPIGE
ncbi:MAG: hypothetical protein GQ549_08085 [Gammaproteobacteria bacterium]|nr:hypothetical protein [Gammaproteobacteria bacterium]